MPMTTYVFMPRWNNEITLIGCGINKLVKFN